MAPIGVIDCPRKISVGIRITRRERRFQRARNPDIKLVGDLGLVEGARLMGPDKDILTVTLQGSPELVGLDRILRRGHDHAEVHGCASWKE